ncbi:MAG: hypothetical protein QM820_11020 [Minicystis sp.]
MSRWVGRVLLALSVLFGALALLQVAAPARETVAVASEASAAGREDRSAMAPADPAEPAEQDTGSLETDDDDNEAAAEALSLPVAAPHVHPPHRSSPARFSVRVGAAPPAVHREVQTPPPRG